MADTSASAASIRSMGNQIGDLKNDITPVLGSLKGLTVTPGDFPDAIASLKISQRLSPYGINWAIYYLAFAYIWSGDLEQGRSHAALYLAREPQEPYAYLLAAIAEAAAGRPGTARDHIAQLLARHPETTCAGFAHAQFYRDPERLRQLVAWLRDAGLPEGK